MANISQSLAMISSHICGHPWFEQLYAMQAQLECEALRQRCRKLQAENEQQRGQFQREIKEKDLEAAVTQQEAASAQKQVIRSFH